MSVPLIGDGPCRHPRAPAPVSNRPPPPGPPPPRARAPTPPSGLGPAGAYGSAGAYSSTYRVDPEAHLVICFMVQMLPNTTDLGRKFPTLVYQALVE